MAEQSDVSDSRQKPIRLGIIGLGAMGSDLLAVAVAHPDYVVPMAADIDAPALKRLRRLHPDTRFTSDPHEVVDHPELDALYVATPPAYHQELVVAGLRRGLAILCEKPLSVSREHADRMLAVADASGRPAYVNFALSDRHAVLEVQRAIQDGEVGTIVGVDIRLRFPRWPRDFQADAGWLATRVQGGFLREVFSHFAYLTDRLVGQIETVAVDVEYPDGADAAETAAGGLLRAGSVPVHLSAFAGVADTESYEWTLLGTRRSYRLRDWDQLSVSDGGAWTPVTLTAERGSEATRLSRFAWAVRGEDVQHLADFAAAYRVQQAVEAFHDTVAEPQGTGVRAIDVATTRRQPTAGPNWSAGHMALDTSDPAVAASLQSGLEAGLGAD